MIVNLVWKILNGVLIGYVFNHQSSPRIISNIRGIDLEHRIIIIPNFLMHAVWRCGSMPHKLLVTCHDPLKLASQDPLRLASHDHLRLRVSSLIIMPWESVDGTGMAVIFTIRAWTLRKSLMENLLLSPFFLVTELRLCLLNLLPCAF